MDINTNIKTEISTSHTRQSKCVKFQASLFSFGYFGTPKKRRHQSDAGIEKEVKYDLDSKYKIELRFAL